jgi:hypothetical protein
VKLSGWARLWIVAGALAASGCGADTSGVYTLYRSSPMDSKARIHVATFDASEGESYNEENCHIAANAFGGPGGIVVRYWCEPGRAR